jgi:Gnt-I system high-affinity gluconate transporter
MFFNVGFIILVPIVFTIADAIGLPLLYLAAPMIASLSVTHGFLPPHPSPSAIAGIFHADMGKIMLYGTIIAIPTILLAGPALSFLYRRFKARPLDEFLNKNNNKNIHLPSATISVIIALMPVFLIGLGGLGNLLFQKDQLWFNLFNGIGNPVIAMFISVLFAIYFLEFRYGKKIKQTMEDLARSISGIAMIFLIIAGAGALKEILVQTHLSEYLGALFCKADISPLVLGWVIAAVIRIAIGSATVAGLTAAGIVLPLISSSSVSPELMVLSIGAGSLIMSHVNDSGFWLFKEYFGLTVKETLCTWSVMETVISLIGLAGVMVLNIFI